uniref:Uncharacterized protein n=1 Tax=Vespula pensylvanica TaxID=30213 RepID=A0A834PE81_VESPE|nr:hypothetical protein H0235_000632 [Vespula pensylvanica]
MRRRSPATTTTTNYGNEDEDEDEDEDEVEVEGEGEGEGEDDDDDDDLRSSNIYSQCGRPSVVDVERDTLARIYLDDLVGRANDVSTLEKGLFLLALLEEDEHGA